MALSLIPLNPDLYPPGAFQIPDEAITFYVGREEGSDLQVNHSSVSAKHARLETLDGDEVNVVDCGSTNGTFVNGVRVERGQVAPGDLLRFATAEFRVTSEQSLPSNGSVGLNGVTHAIKLPGVVDPGLHANPLELERDQLRSELKSLFEEVSELSGHLLGWQECVNSRDEEIANLSASLSSLRAKIEEDSVSHQAEINGVSLKLKEQEEAFSILSADSGREIERLSRTLFERDAELKALRTRSKEEVLEIERRLQETEEARAAILRNGENKANELQRKIAEQDSALRDITAKRETEVASLSEKLSGQEEVSRKLQRKIAELDAALRDITAKRETEVASLSEKLSGQEEVSRKLQRDFDEQVQREQRNLSQISDVRKDLMDRESRIAALHYEVSSRDGSIVQLNQQRQQLQHEKDLAVAEIAQLRVSLATEKQNLVCARDARYLAEANSTDVLNRLSQFGKRLAADWSAWFSDSETNSSGSEADATFSRLEALAGRIRHELNQIEPVWQQFGDHVQEELAARCGAFREEEAELTAEILDRQSELVSLKADLYQFRELIDEEVRRAQGLSRRGTEIEIPERIEAMVIANDREQEIYRAIVERLEVLDRILEIYRGPRKLREVVKDLTEYRIKLVEILEAGGVQPFRIELGTYLGLKQRREVQILSRKGWGTSQYSEYPYRPGEVTKVVRPGYRAGSGEQAVILRKVEVLIRGVED